MQTWRIDLWAQQVKEEGGMNSESSTDMHTLPCIKQTAGGKLLCNTGCSAGSSVITSRVGMGGVGGRLRREGIHAYSQLIHVLYRKT